MREIVPSDSVFTYLFPRLAVPLFVLFGLLHIQSIAGEIAAATFRQSIWQHAVNIAFF